MFSRIDKLIGNPFIQLIVSNLIKNPSRIPSVVVLQGANGTGKSTVAQFLASAARSAYAIVEVANNAVILEITEPSIVVLDETVVMPAALKRLYPLVLDFQPLSNVDVIEYIQAHYPSIQALIAERVADLASGSITKAKNLCDQITLLNTTDTALIQKFLDTPSFSLEVLFYPLIEALAQGRYKEATTQQKLISRSIRDTKSIILLWIKAETIIIELYMKNQASLYKGKRFDVVAKDAPNRLKALWALVNNPLLPFDTTQALFDAFTPVYGNFLYVPDDPTSIFS